MNIGGMVSKIVADIKIGGLVDSNEHHLRL